MIFGVYSGGDIAGIHDGRIECPCKELLVAFCSQVLSSLDRLIEFVNGGSLVLGNRELYLGGPKGGRSRFTEKESINI